MKGLESRRHAAEPAGPSKAQAGVIFRRETGYEAEDEGLVSSLSVDGDPRDSGERWFIMYQHNCVTHCTKQLGSLLLISVM